MSIVCTTSVSALSVINPLFLINVSPSELSSPLLEAVPSSAVVSNSSSVIGAGPPVEDSLPPMERCRFCSFLLLISSVPKKKKNESGAIRVYKS